METHNQEMNKENLSVNALEMDLDNPKIVTLEGN